MQHETASPARQINVLIVDDHRVVADAICTLLEVTDEMRVVDRVYDPNAIVDKMRALQPDVVICDLEMPGGDPLEAAAEGLKFSPNTTLMVLTAFPTDAHIVRATTLGVRGFLTKHEPAETVVDGVRAIMSGHAIYSDEVRERITGLHQGSITEPKILVLSPRELTIVRLVAQGMTTPQIAEMVYRSPKTVDNQISSAMGKTGCANRVELSRWAIREGLIQA